MVVRFNSMHSTVRSGCVFVRVCSRRRGCVHAIAYNRARRSKLIPTHVLGSIDSCPTACLRTTMDILCSGSVTYSYTLEPMKRLGNADYIQI